MAFLSLLRRKPHKYVVSKKSAKTRNPQPRLVECFGFVANFSVSTPVCSQNSRKKRIELPLVAVKGGADALAMSPFRSASTTARYALRAFSAKYSCARVLAPPGVKITLCRWPRSALPPVRVLRLRMARGGGGCVSLPVTIPFLTLCSAGIF